MRRILKQIGLHQLLMPSTVDFPVLHVIYNAIGSMDEARAVLLLPQIHRYIITIEAIMLFYIIVDLISQQIEKPIISDERLVLT